MRCDHGKTVALGTVTMVTVLTMKSSDTMDKNLTGSFPRPGRLVQGQPCASCARSAPVAEPHARAGRIEAAKHFETLLPDFGRLTAMASLSSGSPPAASSSRLA